MSYIQEFKNTTVDTLIIDSKDRISGTSTNFTIKMPIPNKEPNAFHLRNITIPLIYDNVVTGDNDTFVVNSTTYTIPKGQYSIGSLILAMNTLLSATTIVFEQQYGGRVRIYNTVAANFTYDPLGTLYLVGFYLPSGSYAGAQEYIAEYAPYMIYTKYFTLHSEFASSKSKFKISHSDKRKDILIYIPLAGYSLNDVLHYDPQEPIIVLMDGSNNDIIDFSLRDETNKLVDLQEDTIIMNFERLKV